MVAAMTGRQGLVAVLKKKGGSMKTKQLTEAAVALASGLKGATPAATLAAVLAVENKKPDGLFVHTAPGTYTLRPRDGRPPL